MAAAELRPPLASAGDGLGTALAGSVAELMAPGSARPFNQPWYDPIPTSPLTSGMPMGGIGGAFSLTPAGTTPVINFLPGYHVTAVDAPPPRLHHFFFSEHQQPRADSLCVDPHGGYNFARRNAMYPLRDPAGRPWFVPGEPEEAALAHVRAMVATPSLFEDNRASLERWRVPMSPRTRRELAARPGSELANIYLLLDFYGSSLILSDDFSLSLTADVEEREIAGWETYPAHHMHYRALYPLAETRYEDPEHRVRILKRCYTAMLPGTTEGCELPVSFVEFTLGNPTGRVMQASVMQLLENLCGSQIVKHRPGLQDGWCRLVRTARHHENRQVERIVAGGRLTGMLLGQRAGSQGGDFDGKMFAGVWQAPDQDAVCVTVNPAFAADRETQVIAEGMHTGTLSPELDKSLYTGREALSGAVCATCELAPGSTTTITFVMSLDFPAIDFPGHRSRKSYAARFAGEQRAADMAARACELRPRLLPAIARLHRDIAQSPGLDALYPPAEAARRARFVTLLTNLLGFYADTAFADTGGDVFIRECADYPFFNVLDVHFYGVFSLQPLWPAADRIILRRYAAAIMAEDASLRRYGHYTEEPYADLPDPRLESPRAVAGAVPHDLGSPFDCRQDAYVWRNVKQWKDLAPKYALLVLRNFQRDPDPDFLRECAPAVYAAIDYLDAMRGEGECIPLSGGADDTFDNLAAHGITVYCASLWIAGLRAAARIACLLGDVARAAAWTELAARAQRGMVTALWDEQDGYYHLFVTPLGAADLREDAAIPLAALLDRLDMPPALETTMLLTQLNVFLDTGEGARVSAADWQTAREWTARHRPEALRFWTGEPPTRRALRARRKLLLAALCPEGFTPSFHDKLLLDSDDSLVVQLLADIWLDLLDLEPITPPARRRRVLTRILECNYRRHSPTVGAANLVGREGETLESYQAQDVWLGLQFALAAALIDADMAAEAREIIELACVNLQDRARIPFAAPEGFNGNSALTDDELARELGLPSDAAAQLGRELRDAGVLDAGARVNARRLAQADAIDLALRSLPAGFADPGLPARLRALLESWTLRYTASRYHRPGMAFCVLEVLRKRQARRAAPGSNLTETSHAYTEPG